MQDPYLTIWTKPRATFECFFNKRTSNSIFGFPFIIYGFSIGLTIGGEITTLFSDIPTLEGELLSYLFATILSISLVFLILGQIQPWIIKVVGKVWNGKASIHQIANVNSLSGIPHCLILFYQIVLFAFGKNPAIYSINPFFQFVIWIITFRIFLIGLSIVQRFSYGIALLNFLLSLLPMYLIKLMLNN